MYVIEQTEAFQKWLYGLKDTIARDKIRLRIQRASKGNFGEMKIKTIPWNIFEELATERDIQGFVDAAIDESKTDTDPSLLADALAIAAEARRRLGLPQDAQRNTAEIPCEEAAVTKNPTLDEFDKTARSFGYHVTLAPVA